MRSFSQVSADWPAGAELPIHVRGPHQRRPAEGTVFGVSGRTGERDAIRGLVRLVERKMIANLGSEGR